MQLFVNQSITQSIDSIHIKIYTSQKHIIQEYIKTNNLTEYFNKNKTNKYGKNIVKKDNVILFQYFHQNSRYTSFQDYTMIEVHGLKKYNKQDKIKKQNLVNLFLYLKTYNLQYDIQKLDYAIDIKNISIKNLYIRKKSKRNKLNDISIKDKTNIILDPFILEDTDKYNTNRNNRLIAYDKSYKENLEENILRLEINLYPQVFRQIRKLDNPLVILDEIIKQIEKYRIYIIEDSIKRDEIQDLYRESGYKNNKRLNTKIDKSLQETKHQIVKYTYTDIEDMLCYF